jgi:hypothetical protein
MRKSYVIATAAFCLLAGGRAFGLGDQQTSDSCKGEVPVGEARSLQGWTPDETRQWYHCGQGSIFLPAAWFVSLEQYSGEDLFASPDHLSRLGFLPDTKSTDNPLGLPVGFSLRTFDLPEDAGLPQSNIWKGRWVGFTCAACHTGQLNYHGQTIRIDGGSAHVDIQAFTDELGKALVAVSTGGPKRDRFLTRVNEIGADPHLDVGAAFNRFLTAENAQNSALEEGQEKASRDPTTFGFGRIDAVHRGGNYLFAASLADAGNYMPTTAPVRYPMVWDTPYFDWVLYNASIRQPMARNVIEDLGVGAPIVLQTALSSKVKHGILIENLVAMHRLLRKLQSPAWPEQILGPIDRPIADRGQQIFERECKACHVPINPGTHRPNSISEDVPPPTIKVKLVDLDAIGTDPRQALSFGSRFVDLQGIPGGDDQVLYMDAARAISGNIVEQWKNKSAGNQAIEQEIDCGRPNDFRAPPAYRARPLNGIWATPPYLHNGSVPSIRQLLSNPEQRVHHFYLGSWEYDSLNVGLVADSPFPGAFDFDTRLPGNSNLGHNYGTTLSEPDKAALIEYLKSM